MKAKLIRLSTLCLFAAVVFFSLNVNVEAQHRRDDRRAEQREIRRNDDRNYREVIVRDRHYFYRDGYFYDRGPRGYVRIGAPIGARIVFLPRGYEIVRVGRARFYVFGGVYYNYLPREKVYVVVERPR